MQWKPRLTVKNITTGIVAVAAAFGIAFSVIVPNQVTTFLGTVKEAPEKLPATLKLTPEQITIGRMTTFPVEIILEKGDTDPVQIAAQLHFDSAVLQTVYVDRTSDVTPISNEVTATFDNTGGNITLTGFAKKSDTANLHVATVYLRTLGTIGQTTLTLNTGAGDSFVTARNADGNVLSGTHGATINIVLQAP